MKSIRVDLTARLLVGLGLAVVGVSAGCYLLVRSAVSADFDRTLGDKARALGGLVAFDEQGFEFDLAEESAREFMAGPGAEVLQIWLDDGAILARSPSLAGADLPRRAGLLDEPVFWDQELPGGRPGRAAGVLVRGRHDDAGAAVTGATAGAATGGAAPGAAPGVDADAVPDAPLVVLVTARSREPLDRTLAGVAGTFAAGGVLMLLLIVGIVHASVRRALLPVQQLSTRLDAIDAATLSRRIEEGGVPRELAFIAPRLNALLDRLGLAFERERRMTSNVAHELRTPLAELRTAAEIALRWPDDAGLRTDALATAHDVSVRMGELVTALLRLSRIAAGQSAPAREDVAVADAVTASWEPVSTAARDRDQALQVQMPAGLSLRTDRDLLGVAVSNLLANAVEYGTPGRPVRCSAEPVDRGVRLTVSNEAEGLQREDLPHLGEPFWRADRARTSDRHAGLGLALVDAVTAALGGRLSFDLRGREFLAHIELPA